MRKPFRGTTKKEILGHERAAAIDDMKGISDGRVRRRLAKIYDHLPGDMVKQITKIYLKYHK
jgi:hypothetical protein